jgi:hypothetical protein
MKTRAIVSAAIAVVLLGSTMTLSAEDQPQDTQDKRHNDQSDRSRVRQGFAISPVPLSLRNKNRELVGLGSYLVNAAGGCNDCHTHPSFLPGGDPYQGQATVINAEEYLTGGRQFGPFTSPNLTPDEHGRPAGLTWEAFQNAIRTGLRQPDGPRSAGHLRVSPGDSGAAGQSQSGALRDRKAYVLYSCYAYA